MTRSITRKKWHRPSDRWEVRGERCGRASCRVRPAWTGSGWMVPESKGGFNRQGIYVPFITNKQAASSLRRIRGKHWGIA